MKIYYIQLALKEDNINTKVCPLELLMQQAGWAQKM
jgi:hypothetical protein